MQTSIQLYSFANLAGFCTLEVQDVQGYLDLQLDPSLLVGLAHQEVQGHQLKKLMANHENIHLNLSEEHQECLDTLNSTQHDAQNYYHVIIKRSRFSLSMVELQRQDFSC